MVPDLQVVILDDGLQHRGIQCGLNILLTAHNKLYIDDKIFPWGGLRDLKHRNLAAQAIIITKCPETLKPIDKRVLDSRLHLAAFQKLYFSKIVYEPVQLPKLPEGTTLKPVILTGIASPQPFIDHIKATYPKALAMTYPDHHRFTKAEMIVIAREIEKRGCVFTTEKDYERLMLTPLSEALERKVVVVPIHVEIDDAQQFEQQITAYLSEQLRQQIKNQKSKI
jgi:tetraacyldisaccharide 4'-kinase